MKRFLSLCLTLSLMLGLAPITADAGDDFWKPNAAGWYSGGNGTAERPFEISRVEELLKLANDVESHKAGEWRYVNGEDIYSPYSYILTADLDISEFEWTPIGSMVASFQGVFNGNGHTISGLRCAAGGLFGQLSDATVFNLTLSNISISAAGLGNTNYDCMGGLANIAWDSFIMNCYVSGTLDSSGTGGAGGVIGYASNSTLTDCSFDGSIADWREAGGLVGINYDSTLLNCTANGDITYSSSGDLIYAGGLVGYNQGTLLLNCTANVAVTLSGGADEDIAGGLVGNNFNGALSNCTANGDVTISGADANCAGGLVGNNFNGALLNCTANGDVTLLSVAVYVYKSDCAGGLVGSSSGNITNCTASGDVSGFSVVGGVAGTGENITNCIASGKVTLNSAAKYRGYISKSDPKVYVKSDIGDRFGWPFVYDGFAGGIAGFGNSIENCLFTGTVHCAYGAPTADEGPSYYNESVYYTDDDPPRAYPAYDMAWHVGNICGMAGGGGAAGFSVRYEQPEITAEVDGPAQNELKIYPETYVPQSKNFTSSKMGVAAADASSGAVTALEHGKTQITAEIDGKTAQYSLKVRNGNYGGGDTMLYFALSNFAYQTGAAAFKGKNVSDYIDMIYDHSSTMWGDKEQTEAQWMDDVAGDWKIVDTKWGKPGFFAVAFESPDGNERIIAYRGTASAGGCATDIAFEAGNALNDQFDDALVFYYQQKASGKRVRVTGHSLGGALAAAVSMLTGAEAVAVNGASGQIIDNVFKKYPNEMSDNFTGVDDWKFSNHMTESTGTLWSGINESITRPNFDKYNTYIYPAGQNYQGRNQEHDVGSIVNYNNAAKQFGLGDPTQIGRADSIKSTSGGNVNTLLGLQNQTWGTTGNDYIDDSGNNVKTTVYAGNGDDNVRTGWRSDIIDGGAGTNHLNGGAGEDTYIINNGSTNFINDTQGNTIIKLNGGSMVGSPVSVTLTGKPYYKINVSDGSTVYVNKQRNLMTAIFNTVKVVDRAGKTLTTLQMAPAAPFTAQSADTGVLSLFSVHGVQGSVYREVRVSGHAQIAVYDGGGQLAGTYSNNTDAQIYEDFGHFYMTTGGNPYVEAQLFLEGYTVRVTSGETVKCEAIALYENDETVLQLKSGDISIPAGQYLETDGETYIRLSGGGDVAFETEDISEHNVKLAAAEGGQIIDDLSGKYLAGEKITVSAMANPGYRPAGWESSGGGEFERAGDSITVFTAGNADTVLTARFELITCTAEFLGYFEFDEDSNALCTVSINNFTPDRAEMTAWAAVYKGVRIPNGEGGYYVEKDVLVDLKRLPLDLSPGEGITQPLMFALPEKSGEDMEHYFAEIFLWGGEREMEPVTGSATREFQR